MRGRSRQRVVRLLLSAVLGSDLSNREVAELQDELEAGDIHRELAYILRFLSQHVGIRDELAHRQPSFSLSSDKLYEAAKKKRVPKAQLIKVISSLSSRRVAFDESMSIREILDEFVEISSDETLSHLLDFLESSSTGGDQYLRGILDRKKDA